MVYAGDPSSFEATHHGHEIAHLTAYQFDPGPHLGLIEEGLAVVLDGSVEDRDRTYALDVLAGEATSPGDFTEADLEGRSYAKSGSLIAFLIGKHGSGAALEIYRRARLTGSPLTPRTFDAWMEEALQAVGGSWTVDRSQWSKRVNAEIARQRSSQLSGAAEVRNALRSLQKAAREGDVDAYRAGLDSFYCDWADESTRHQLAEQSVAARPTRFDIGWIREVEMRNFPEAWVRLVDSGSGEPTGDRVVIMEKFPEGWRLTWDPLWAN